MVALCDFEAKLHECKTALEMVKTRTFTLWCKMVAGQCLSGSLQKLS